MIIDLKEHLDKKISIITPIFMPDLELFKQAIKSMLNQTDKNWRWIIVLDGAKTVNAVDPVRNLLEDDRIDVIPCNKRKGVSRARNIGLDKVKCGFVGFLDCDNWYHVKTVQYVKRAIEESKRIEKPNTKLMFSFNQVVFAQPEHYKDTGLYVTNVREMDRELSLLDLAPMSIIDLGQIFHTCGNVRFDPAFNRLVDWDYIMSLLDNDYQHRFFPMFLSFYDDLYRDNRISAMCDFKVNRERIIKKWRKRWQEVYFKNKYLGDLI